MVEGSGSGCEADAFRDFARPEFALADSGLAHDLMERRDAPK
jgi:hypothetical protein